MDPRQRHTVRALREMTQQFEDADSLQVINLTHGYHASQVDMGEITARAEQLVGSMLDAGATKRQVGDALMGALSEWVQRVKSVSVKWYRHSVQVIFTTKDDHGWYSYGLELGLGA